MNEGVNGSADGLKLEPPAACDGGGDDEAGALPEAGLSSDEVGPPAPSEPKRPPLPDAAAAW